MGLFKTGLITSILATLCFSCTAPRKSAMSVKDQELLNQTLKNSILAYNSNHENLVDNPLLQELQMPKSVDQAILIYQEHYKKVGVHDYPFLQEIGFKILEDAIYFDDLEAQLLSLFAVDIANHPKLLPILEQALDSPYNYVQLLAVQTLARLPDDKANQLLVKGCASPFFDVAMTTAFILAERKHHQVMGLLESLMSKAPPEAMEFFPVLFGSIDNDLATQKLKKFLTSPDEKVRLAAAFIAGKTNRTELIPEIRLLAKQQNPILQEAAFFALGELKDEGSTTLLQANANDASETVRLSALYALLKLGHHSSIAQIEQLAQNGNLFAIQLLKECSSDNLLLEALAYQKQNKNVALNAALALFQKKAPSSLAYILPLLIPEDRNILITEIPSSAMTMTAKKLVYKNSSHFQEAMQFEQMSLNLRLQLLSQCAEFPEDIFLDIATKIIEADQRDMIPAVIHHMIALNTTHAKDLLKEWQQKVGSPYVRQWSCLALLRLNEPGPWKKQVLSWIRQQKYHQIVRIKDLTKLRRKKLIDPFEINPLEKSDLLLESYITIAQKQDEEGIEVILDSLTQNNLKNKYAIAGLLMLASQ